MVIEDSEADDPGVEGRDGFGGLLLVSRRA